MKILICKICGFLLRLIGKGTAYPGGLALKFDKDILTKFKMPEFTIFVTGTTGKTSISGVLTTIFENNGYKVTTNGLESNLMNGILTALIKDSSLNYKIKSDVMIIEVDERYVKEVFKYITPKYFIINNLSRDQLARNGHFDIVFNEINNSIKDETTLFLNADDPLVTKFSLYHNNKIIYYGLDKTKYSKKTSNDILDVLYCPKCYTKLDFNYFHYANLGDYKCPKCDFKRPEINYLAKLSKDGFDVLDKHIKLPNDAIYNVYNLLVCYAISCEANVESLETLNNLSIKIKRFTPFKLGNKEGIILLSKNETPISYNQSLEYISNQKEKKTVAIGFTRISGKYDLKDISWLYDINFELLNDKSVEKIILIGPFAYDLKVRMKYAGIDLKKVQVCLDYTKTKEYLIKYGKGKLYCVFYFDMDKYFRKILG